MSTRYNARSKTAPSPKPQAHRQQDTLSPAWSLFYLTAALLISVLYYCNPGLWRLFEHARYWINWIYSFM